ncbi:MAG: imidazole glycerol phosphate synthase subunit HisH [Ardenticatenaceae bacterium]|nr:imidazole glycerol phosphate synthase subunit HisH [Ardenticatenaceae bacterium]
MSTKITMIDYGASNIRSALKAFEHLGADIELTNRPEAVANATKLVLPGVGAFGSGMAALHRLNLVAPIQDAVARGIPLLGICVGMQFLFDSSDEMGHYEGLGVIPGHVTRFVPNGLKIPHMGWNQIHHAAEDHWLLNRVPSDSYVYFVHSYHCIPDQPHSTISSTEYGIRFSAVVAHQNVFGIQFHPEKSQKHGLQMLQNYIDYRSA